MKKTPLFFRYPDNGNSGNGGDSSPTTLSTASAPSTKKKATPRADADLGTVADLAADAWLNNPELTLLWTTAADFRALVDRYLAGVQARRDASALRPGATLSLSDLEDSMDDAVSEVKIYIRKKFKKAGAAAQYPRYGLVHHGDSWDWPEDRDDLKHSIESMKNAVAADGFGDEDYGTAFWTDAQHQFHTLFDKAKGIDGSISGKAADKNADKSAIRKALKALHKLIEANYPDTAASVLRAWGWQKEDY